MYDTRTISAAEYIPMNVYRTILLWVGEIYQISKIAKTSVNKRRILCHAMFRLG